MMSVLYHIAYEHDLWLVLLAVLICASGSWWVFRLFARASVTHGLQRNAWLVLTTIAGGATIWCTHFVAMIGYRIGVPFRLDPSLTVLSLLTALAGVGLGFRFAAGNRSPAAALTAGGLVGLAIAAMHYLGMMAYHLPGTVSWNARCIFASILLVIAFSAASMLVAAGKLTRHHKGIAATLFAVGILSLHFVGMAAFEVEPMLVGTENATAESLAMLALAVASVGFTVVATGAASYVIDARTRADSFEQIRQMALNDSLTSLPNRASFHDYLGNEMTRTARDGGEFAVIRIDLDRFKEVNDLHGHAAGDTVLRTIGERLCALPQGEDFVARLGGDEFAAAHRISDTRSLGEFLGHLWFALTGPLQLDGHSHVQGASIGVALYPRDAAEVETLLNNADLALYRAKSGRTEKICFYEAAMDEAVRERRALANDLREAIANDQLEVHYQVQASISTGEIKGFEALARWNHPTRGAISPADFVALAERKGLILQLGEWVLRRACIDAQAWDADYTISVNCSPLQFADPNFTSVLTSILMETGLPPRRLELELTESAIFADRERALHMLHSIKALGVSIALDDFGTGYSSLDILRTFPFDRIKLDASFVRELEKNSQAVAMIRAVLALGKSLDIPVLAEGIETQGQLALLQQEGCDEAQGYLLGRPVRLNAVLDSLDHGIFASRYDSADKARRNSDAA